MGVPSPPPLPGVASTQPPTPPPGASSSVDLSASPVPPAPVIPEIPRPSTTSYTKLPRLLKATYMVQGEKLLWETRPTRWYYLPLPTLILVLIIVLDAVIFRTVSGGPSFLPALPGPLGSAASGSLLAHAYEITAVLLLMLGVIDFGIHWLRYASTVYVVTNTRVIRQKGILGKDFDEVQLLQIRGVDVSQRVWQRLLRYGMVKISAEFGGSGQAMGNEQWAGVPKPIEFERTIEEGQQRLRGILPPVK
ncbi:MAG: PH domain-containing protein [Euryarchaeota archaeon]|nr:PH domain-containing protein [Euryarchaeota archaeon]MDE1835879.1 PH domain-containing protein [Euryarchaeota archaeon]MDE2044443.1 PH domain-containing protein [Thermoplasmata archaeon]